MKNIVSVILVLLSMCLTAAAQSNFDWITGEWNGTFSGVAIKEVWVKKDDSTFVGKGYVVSGKDTIINETLLIQEIGRHWVYIAAINNKAPVLFTRQDGSAPNEIIFENKEHDFPQSIIYERKENGELHARIEGKVLGKKKKEEYIYRKK